MKSPCSYPKSLTDPRVAWAMLGQYDCVKFKPRDLDGHAPAPHAAYVAVRPWRRYRSCIVTSLVSIKVAGCARGVRAAPRDGLVEVGALFDQPDVLQQSRVASAGGENARAGNRAQTEASARHPAQIRLPQSPSPLHSGSRRFERSSQQALMSPNALANTMMVSRWANAIAGSCRPLSAVTQEDQVPLRSDRGWRRRCSTVPQGPRRGHPGRRSEQWGRSRFVSRGAIRGGPNADHVIFVQGRRTSLLSMGRRGRRRGL
jgi:hypothetical protein